MVTGTSQPPANVLGILEKIGDIEVYVQAPSAYEHVPTFTNIIPIYGQIESTALWSEVDDQRLRVLCH